VTGEELATMETVAVGPKGAQRLRRGGNWAYRNELLHAFEPASPGEVVRVVDGQRNPIGQAFASTRSPIALRLLTREAPEQVAVDDAFFRARIERALVRRRSLQTRDAFRVLHGESDGLPGLLVDRYADRLVMQTLSEGADARKERLARILVEVTGATQVVCRDDASGRDFEGLPREKKLLFGGGPTQVVFHEGPTALEVDLLEDMKTGSFLDQVDNHLRAAELASGEALDCFSYHGGFALALAGSCTKVTAIEQDPGAAAKLRANVARNGKDNIAVMEANVFDVLRDLERAGRTFDTVVIDPPGLTKRKEGYGSALRAYRELNLRGFKLLKPDGLLVTCSCSGKLDRAAFEEMVLAAAKDAHRQVQILERRGAGLDHPVLAAVPESEYLKAFFLRVL
jgi:23S rRNA (cytosine1962-C5)-methyltransferase